MADQDIKKLFGSRVQKLRKANNLTREGLAQLCDFSVVNITKIETGERFISADSLRNFAAALKVKPLELFNFNGDDLRKSETRQQIEALLRNQNEATVVMLRDVIARIIQEL